MLEAPEFFDLDADDALTVLREEFGPEDRPVVEAAVRGCPKAALSIMP